MTLELALELYPKRYLENTLGKKLSDEYYQEYIYKLVGFHGAAREFRGRFKAATT